MLRRLQPHRILAPALVATVLVATLSISAASYIGIRVQLTDAAETSTLHDAQMASQLLVNTASAASTTTAPSTSTANSQTGSSARSHATTPVAEVITGANTALVNSLRDVSGDAVTLYVAHGTSFTATASTLGQAHTQQTVAGTAARAAAAGTSYTGIVQQGGASYVVSVVPVAESSGKVVGALETAQPLDAVTAPATKLGAALLLAVLLVALLALLVTRALSGALSGGAMETLGRQLGGVDGNAADLHRLSRRQRERAHRQERSARQVSEIARELDALLEALGTGQQALGDTASEIWAGISQPGFALTSDAALRLARQAAVTAGRIGAATTDARERCRQLVGMMNQLVAEGRMLADDGFATGECAANVGAAIAQMQATLGLSTTIAGPQAAAIDCHERGLSGGIPAIGPRGDHDAWSGRFEAVNPDNGGRPGSNTGSMRAVRAPTGGAGGYTGAHQLPDEPWSRSQGAATSTGSYPQSRWGDPRLAPQSGPRMAPASQPLNPRAALPSRPLGVPPLGQTGSYRGLPYSGKFPTLGAPSSKPPAAPWNADPGGQHGHRGGDPRAAGSAYPPMPSAPEFWQGENETGRQREIGSQAPDNPTSGQWPRTRDQQPQQRPPWNVREQPNDRPATPPANGNQAGPPPDAWRSRESGRQPQPPTPPPGQPGPHSTWLND